jgi:hypothetical protein
MYVIKDYTDDYRVELYMVLKWLLFKVNYIPCIEWPKFTKCLKVGLLI